MKAEIIGVGSELLLGQIANTNAQFLSKRLAHLGIDVFFHTVVGDNSARLKSVIQIAEKRSDLIIFTGGLGPTKDDLTKEIVADHIERRLVTDHIALKSIKSYFQRTNRPMSENNKKQALVIEGSNILPNDYGMAPGMIVQAQDHIYMLLPGPPKEMEPMFLQYGEKVLKKYLQSNSQIVSRVLHFFGIGESMLETKIKDLIDGQKNPTIAPLAAEGEVSLRITAKHNSTSLANQLIQETERMILSRVGDFFYGYDSTSLMNEAFLLLKERNWTIACAESLTGGMFQKELTSIPGASSVLKGGIVCYATEVKHNILNVKQETIDTHGVVSAQCASELAQNVRTLLHADIGISFTGVAGPDEQEGKPAGTVFVGLSVEGRPVYVESLHLAGSRENIRIRTVKHGCWLLLDHLKK